MFRRAVSAASLRSISFMSYTALPNLIKPKGKPMELPIIDFDWKNGVPPVLSPRQTELHYKKHHQAYIDKFNALAGSEYDGKTVEEIMTSLVKASDKKVLFNQAAQHFNHSFYWFCLAPKGKPMPKSIENAINKQFGSVEKFKELFSQSAVNNFGSGWTWLCINDKKELVIENSSNAACPLTCGLRPIFAVDVWEHAYYKDFENRRPDYIKEIWGIVNWEFVEKMYNLAMK